MNVRSSSSGEQWVRGYSLSGEPLAYLLRGALGKGGVNTSTSASIRTLPKRVFQQFTTSGTGSGVDGDFNWGDTLFAV